MDEINATQKRSGLASFFNVQDQATLIHRTMDMGELVSMSTCGTSKEKI